MAGEKFGAGGPRVFLFFTRLTQKWTGNEFVKQQFLRFSNNIYNASKEERLRITNDVNNENVLYYNNNDVQQTYSREPEVL